MKQTVNFTDFVDTFNGHDRGDQFTYEGLRALFDYIEEYEDSGGEEIELDVIALCCEYAEYDDIQAFWEDYDKEDYPDIETIENHTQYIEVGNKGFIIQSF